MGSLKSGHGRTEMPYLGKGPWGPFQALLPNLTKVSESPGGSFTPISADWGSVGCPSTSHPQFIVPTSSPPGILKKKCLPTISEKSSLLRLPLEQGTGSSRGSSASDVSRNGPPPRPPPRQSLQEQLNGVMPIAMSIKAGTVDEDSSGSE